MNLDKKEKKVGIWSWNVGLNSGNCLNFLETFKESWDILCLNEIFEGSFQLVGSELDLEYGFFGPSHGEFGNAILSKYPIVNAENFILTSRTPNEHGRSLLRSTIEIENGKTVTIFLTHLEHRLEKTRLAQLDEIFSHIHTWQNSTHSKQEGSGFLLVGDFNCLTFSDYEEKDLQNIMQMRKEKGFVEEEGALLNSVSERLKSEYGMRDIWTELNDQIKMKQDVERFRTHTRFPIRIDYLFASRDFSFPFLEIKTLKTEVSDHFPVVTYLTLQT